MELNENLAFKVFLLPIVVALVTTLSLQFFEDILFSDLIGFSSFEEMLFLAMIFLFIYFFILIFIVPFEIFLSRKLKNTIIYFCVFNSMGIILFLCIDLWLFDARLLKSFYIIFPLFSVLSIILSSFFEKREHWCAI